MFDNINKSKINFDKYIKLKSRTLIRSYSERFKWVDKILYWFSWFGNGVSIFLAFFFLQALFFSSFNDVSNSIFISVGIIFFLSMFELLKRFIFGMFSLEYIKRGFNIFKISMIGFLIGTSLLIIGSFYFSLNGAKKFVDNQDIFQTTTENNINTKVDSVNQFYFNQYIKPLMDENVLINQQNLDYSNQAARTNYKTKYTNLIVANNIIKEKNNETIKEYEKRRDADAQKIQEIETVKLEKGLIENKTNIWTFIIISSLIEIIIMLGIYFDKFYDYKIVLEYEDTVISTPEFRRWHKFNFLLELIYGKVKQKGDRIPTSNAIIELSELSGAKITTSELDKFIKILYYLNIIILENNRRVIASMEDEGKKALKEYFDIK